MNNNDQVSILVVDDSPTALFDFSFKLEEKFNAKDVHIVNNIPNAKEVLEEKAIEVATVDLMMPGVNGADLINDMKAQDTWKDIPVIIVTSSGSDNDLEQGFSKHVSAYLHKPVERENLINTILKCTNNLKMIQL